MGFLGAALALIVGTIVELLPPKNVDRLQLGMMAIAISVVGPYGILTALFKMGVLSSPVQSQCPQCGYPIGSNPVCTECGAPVRPQPRRDDGV